MNKSQLYKRAKVKKIVRNILMVNIGFIISLAAHGANIILENNEQNCKKISNWASDSREAVGAKLGVSMQAISFIRPKYEYGCFAIADTPKGPYQCYVQSILSGDKGRTAFANIVMFGNVSCDPIR